MFGGSRFSECLVVHTEEFADGRFLSARLAAGPQTPPLPGTLTSLSSLDGTSYEIDLNSHNLDTLTRALDPFIKNAHTTSKRRTSSGGRSATAPSRNLAEVRVWARENGFAVSDRGRVAAEIMTAFEQRS